MTHEEAVSIYAAEGYIINDLTVAERSAFEEHYADCEDCFGNVKDGLTLAVALAATPTPNGPGCIGWLLKRRTC